MKKNIFTAVMQMLFLYNKYKQL